LPNPKSFFNPKIILKNLCSHPQPKFPSQAEESSGQSHATHPFALCWEDFLILHLFHLI